MLPDRTEIDAVRREVSAERLDIKRLDPKAEMVHVTALRTGGRSSLPANVARHTHKIDLRAAGPQMNETQSLHTFIDGTPEHFRVEGYHALEIQTPQNNVIDSEKLHTPLMIAEVELCPRIYRISEASEMLEML